MYDDSDDEGGDEGGSEGSYEGSDEGGSEGSDEGVMKLILSCLRGFEYKQTDGQTDICKCRGAFATANL